MSRSVGSSCLLDYGLGVHSELECRARHERVILQLLVFIPVARLVVADEHTPICGEIDPVDFAPKGDRVTVGQREGDDAARIRPEVKFDTVRRGRVFPPKLVVGSKEVVQQIVQIVLLHSPVDMSTDTPRLFVFGTLVVSNLVEAGAGRLGPLLIGAWRTVEFPTDEFFEHDMDQRASVER